MARRIVRRRFPDARAAWLGGSVVSGTASATSDLDITVLLDGPPAPFRESTVFDGWPVELFVQTEESLMRFCDNDIQRRRPTTMRLVGSSVVLVDTDGAGEALRERLRALDLAGPAQATADDLQSARYLVTDLLDDLLDAADDEAVVVVAALWAATAELLLLANRAWSGSGKWLLRELHSLDARNATAYADQLSHGLRSAADDTAPLRRTVEAILEQCGGRMFDGYRRGAPHGVTTAAQPDDPGSDASGTPG